MNIKNAKDHLARARGHITSATSWLEQEETDSKRKRDFFSLTDEAEAGIREIAREEVKEFMKNWVHEHIYDIK